ncbi:MAG: hypothetical protein AAB596_00305 [Patescibacteria group bacterium]|mgnify:CR=1 FL=1
MKIMRININLILGAAIIATGFFTSYFIIAQAQETEIGTQQLDISYPVKELGNCKNETQCRTYCDKPENIGACVNFAEKNNLISKEEARKAKAFIKIGEGPAGCKNKKECETFCDNPNNMEVCLNFAEENDLISEEELREARLVAKTVKEGATLPGGCKNKKDCELYCDNSEHMEECLAFAEQAGFMPEKELKEAKKAMKAIKSGINPPGNCRGRKECDVYCSESIHMEECFNFAVAAGFIEEKEVEEARRIMPLMIAGEMPGDCRGKEECEAYCEDGTHSEECANFAIKAGFMKPEEAEMFRKTGGKGPGDCRGKEECEAYCNNSNNAEVCFGFAKEHGLIPEKDIENMREGIEHMKNDFSGAPSEVQECLKSNLGLEILEKIQAGVLMPGPQIGDSMRKCFEGFRPKSMIQGESARLQEGRLQEGMPMIGSPERMRGPGGCSGFEDCTRYCSDQTHKEECEKFKPANLPKGLPEGFKEAPYREMPQGEIPSEMFREGFEGQMMPAKEMPFYGEAPNNYQNIIPSPDMIKKMMEEGQMPTQEIMSPQRIISPFAPLMPIPQESVDNLLYKEPFLSPVPSEKFISPPPSDIMPNILTIFIKAFKSIIW